MKVAYDFEWISILKVELFILKWKSQHYVFIELNFTVTFLLIKKTWDDQFVGK